MGQGELVDNRGPSVSLRLQTMESDFVATRVAGSERRVLEKMTDGSMGTVKEVLQKFRSGTGAVAIEHPKDRTKKQNCQG
ncbi:hypothetical protein ID866_7945 [Astraeus odoratus]|nr:hypothetical protein ID866_7945 [Astraeus odoratus]